MARNIFSLTFTLYPKIRSIQEISNEIIDLLFLLGVMDDIFLKFNYSKIGSKNTEINILELGQDSSKKKLAETILDSNLTDIKNYEKELNPKLDYFRDFGFSLLLQFKKNNKQHFSITGNIGTNQFPNLRIEYFPLENSDYDFDWYFTILKEMTIFLNPKYSCVRIILDSFTSEYNKIKIIYPLGWISYFAKDSNIIIPENLGIEVEEAKNGKYLILTRGDFTTSIEKFTEAKDKLMELMLKLKEISPEYSL